MKEILVNNNSTKNVLFMIRLMDDYELVSTTPRVPNVEEEFAQSNNHKSKIFGIIDRQWANPICNGITHIPNELSPEEFLEKHDIIGLKRWIVRRV